MNSKYEYILHVQPGQIIKDYRADIYINESLPLRSIHVPELKTNPNEITSQLKSSSIASIARDLENSPNRAHVIFKPDIQYQKLVAKNLVSTRIIDIWFEIYEGYMIEDKSRDVGYQEIREEIRDQTQGRKEVDGD